MATPTSSLPNPSSRRSDAKFSIATRTVIACAFVRGTPLIVMSDSRSVGIESDPLEVVVSRFDRGFVSLDRCGIVWTQYLGVLTRHTNFLHIEHRHDGDVRFLVAPWALHWVRPPKLQTVLIARPFLTAQENPKNAEELAERQVRRSPNVPALAVPALVGVEWLAPFLAQAQRRLRRRGLTLVVHLGRERAVFLLRQAGVVPPPHTADDSVERPLEPFFRCYHIHLMPYSDLLSFNLYSPSSQPSSLGSSAPCSDSQLCNSS